jgi:alkylated DNA repair dioxygenase AlkB
MKTTKETALPGCFEMLRGYLPGIDLAEILGMTWDQPTIRIFGRECKIPRLTRWFGEAGYTYSGAANAPAPMPAWLDKIRRGVEAKTGARFNSALVNYYRDGRDSVAWHADDEKELGARPTIASLSLGASRTFYIRLAADNAAKWRVELADGDLLIMRDEAQSDYQHSVPKTAAPVGPRINITFRWIDA